MSDVVIRVENLSKRYTIRHGRNGDDGLRHAIHDFATAPLRWVRGFGSSVSRGRSWVPGLGYSSRGNGNGSGPRSPVDGHPNPQHLTPDTQYPTPNRQYPVPNTQHPTPCSEEFWALRGVSFEVKRGEVVGIIGRNGAGKSTLLKILSRITEPTEGRVRIRGRVASLLEIGTGFHPELTGRENIFVNGAILGMSRAEIQKKFDEIVDFSGVEKFLDTPVKRYSSGMHVRLAFAVAAHLEPEILIVDEVLAVGDAEFQQKCLGKMKTVSSNEGRTVLFVSHNMTAVASLCKSVILLDEGRLVLNAGVRDTLYKYHSIMQGTFSISLSKRLDRRGTGVARCIAVQVLEANNEPLCHVSSGEPIRVLFTVQSDTRIDRILPGLNIYDEAGSRVATFWCGFLGRTLTLRPGLNQCSLRVNRLDLVPGVYRLAATIGRESETLDDIDNVGELHITAPAKWNPKRYPDGTHHGFFFPEFQWEGEQ